MTTKTADAALMRPILRKQAAKPALLLNSAVIVPCFSVLGKIKARWLGLGFICGVCGHDLLRLLDSRLRCFFGQAERYSSVDSLFYQ